MPDIVLATLNAKYIHASFGLRCLLANLGELRPRATLSEYTINQRPIEIAEAILAQNPRIVGLGVYIWNVALTTELVALLKAIRPDLVIVLGGPEVSHETEEQVIVRMADFVIRGEGDLAFAALCRQLLDGERPAETLISPPLPDLAKLASPYSEYTADDIANRLIYVEASRGCPFSCEFCLSSIGDTVRQFDLDAFLGQMETLQNRGVQHFKFVDRTFNLNLAITRRILTFFLERLRPGLFLHFEMVPDRLPEELRELLARFPAGAMQVEVGVQTFNPEVAANISRRQNYERLEDNIRWLREYSQIHIHADLIAGLPGESVESFASGFDRLVALNPHEIQVGILKRLRGTPIRRHDTAFGMIYSPLAPYELLRNALIDFPAMQRLRRFARYWDLIGNSGNFVATTPLVWAGAASPFNEFSRLSDWLYEKEGRHHALALVHLMERLFEYLTIHRTLPPQQAATALWQDFQRGRRAEIPPFLKPFLPADTKPTPASIPCASPSSAKRQSRHTGI